MGRATKNKGWRKTYTFAIYSIATLIFGDLGNSNPLYDYLLHESYLLHDHRKELGRGSQDMMKIC